MEARLSHDKLQRIRAQIATWLGKKKATKREILSLLSLVGLLQHATKVVRPGQTFIARMYKAAAKLKELHHVTRLTKEFKSDLQWWNLFAATWNGVSFIVETSRQDPVLCIQTDASGHRGCGARFDCRWLQHAWSAERAEVSIMAKELVPIIFGCAVWGLLLTKTPLEFQCNNLSLVEAVN